MIQVLMPGHLLLNMIQVSLPGHLLLNSNDYVAKTTVVYIFCGWIAWICSFYIKSGD